MIQGVIRLLTECADFCNGYSTVKTTISENKKYQTFPTRKSPGFAVSFDIVIVKVDDLLKHLRMHYITDYGERCTGSTTGNNIKIKRRT